MYRNTLIMLIMWTGVAVLGEINDSMALDSRYEKSQTKSYSSGEELVISIISEMNVSID